MTTADGLLYVVENDGSLAWRFATRDVIVQVYQASGNYEQVTCDVSLPSTNSTRLNFAAAPASNAYRVVVMG